MDKGAVIQLAEGVEGFATPKHLVKEDGSQAQQGETLQFKVIEFNKDSKKIIVSHTRTFQEGKDDVRESDTNRERTTKKTVKQINDNLEKTTLGDLDIFQKLKEEK